MPTDTDKFLNYSWRPGGCHCKAVRFEAFLPSLLKAHECNCSICRPVRYLHTIVPRDHLRILSGEDKLVEYRFHTHVARHLFCEVCGIKSFYQPRTAPECWTVNVNCLDDTNFDDIEMIEFDGEHWEEHVGELRERYLE